MLTQRSLLSLSLLLILAYSALHALWVERYPPTLNDDHFHTAIIVSQLEDDTLYPNDLAWSSTVFARNHGFLFLGALQLGETLFDRFQDAWPAYTFVLMLVYLTGFALFVYELTSVPWLALTLSFISSMPIYMTVSFSDWGITSVYAHLYVTALAGWALWGLLRFLRTSPPAWAWGLLGFAISLTIYFNPVNGGGMVGILVALLILEALGGRLHWRYMIAFTAGSLLGASGYVIRYSQTISEVQTATSVEIEAANSFITNLANERLYPWGISQTLMPILVVLVVVSALTSLIFYNRKDAPPWWIILFAAIQLAPGYLLIRHPLFLLALGYWVFHAARADRWDRFFLAMVAVVNLVAVVSNAMAHFLWLDAGIDGMFTLAYEPIRLLQWVMVPLYVWLARWVAELISDELNPLDTLAALCMLAIPLSIFGSDNPIKDDAVFMKAMLPLRWGLPLFAFALVYAARRDLPRWAVPLTWAGFGAAGALFVVSMGAWENLSEYGWMILLLLAGVLQFVYQPRTLQNAGLAAFFAGTILLPIAGYHKDKPDRNWCDLPNLNACVDGDNVIAAGEWFQENTPREAEILVIGIQPERFVSFARRTTLHANYYQVFWFRGPRGLQDAQALAETLQGTNPLRPGYVGDAELLRCLDELEAHYIAVFGDGYTFDLPKLYENESVIVYGTN
jgi:hypothetical protein